MPSEYLTKINRSTKAPQEDCTVSSVSSRKESYPHTIILNDTMAMRDNNGRHEVKKGGKE